MIISKTVQVNICNSNIKYYKEIRYNNIKNGDKIEVEINNLPRNSHVFIKCVCDYCGQPKDIAYKTYLKQINCLSKKYACKNCVGKKVRESNMIKYGVPSPMCLKSIQEKSKQTTLKHFGVQNGSQSPEVKQKIKNTNFEKYGVSSITKLLEFQERLKETRIKKYGVPYMLQLPEIQQKVRNTTLERYGVENASQSNSIKQKKKDTLLKNYGVEYPSQSPIIKKRFVIRYIKIILYKHHFSKDIYVIYMA